MESMFVQIHISTLFLGSEQILNWLVGTLYLLISEEYNTSDEFSDLVLDGLHSSLCFFSNFKYLLTEKTPTFMLPWIWRNQV